MIRCRRAADGYEEIIIVGENSHLEAKALQSKLGQIIGRGKVEGRIGQSNIRIVVANDGTAGGEAHSAIEER